MNTSVGSVLVVGGGIGGTQAALDLAGAGFKVHLVEKETAIGGVMAQLDKTFPTNDCAMCTLAPRLVDAARNLNIEKITGAELEKLEGVPGNFKATIRRKARYIDLSRCTGCAACVEKCPVRTANEFDMELVKRTAIYRRYPQAVPGGFAIDKQGVSPCRLACPAGVNAHAYVALIAQRRFAEALEVEKLANPFPAICGRICPHKCEADCTRNKVDQPVAIAALKRFLADWEVGQRSTGVPPVPGGPCAADTETRPSGAQGESRRMTGLGGECAIGHPGGDQRPPGTEPPTEGPAKGACPPPPSSFGLRAAHLPSPSGRGDGGEGSRHTPRSEKIAIIGSGPAGLACARQLALRGNKVTVFEALSAPGGMLKWGIPDYRLPAAVLDVEIKSAVLDLGVELRLNSPVGDKVKLSDLRKDGFKAFFLAIGAHKGLKLEVPGESDFPLPPGEGQDEGSSLRPSSERLTEGVCSNGLMDAVRFLRLCKAGKVKKVQGKVAVVGGGNVAIDAARSAWRLGATEVKILYRRSRAEMPANPWEIEEAEHEGVKIEFLVAPTRIIGTADGGSRRLAGLECVRMELGEPDASGRRRPVPVKGSEFSVAADVIIPAIGQQPVSQSFASEGIKAAKNGTFEVNKLTLQTCVPDVFAGGDAVLGPATAVEAIEAGMRAAESIHRFLRGESLSEGRQAPDRAPAKKEVADVAPNPRNTMRSVPVEKRRGNFDEVELGFSEEEAVAEAQRCLNCAGCCECLKCVEACEAKAIRHEMACEEAVELRIGAVIAAPGFELFNPDVKKELGYDRYANVITGLEFERILSASGPFMGKIQRLSDGAHPGKIAFIQCVGSRETGHDYCSSVCCMYAIKQAVIAKEHEPGLECHVFFIDIRAFGKGFDEYYNRAKELGVKFRRCRPSAIREAPATKNPVVRYSAEDDKLTSEEFDIVVLSTGLRPPADAARLAAALGIELDEHGFACTPHFQPVRSTRPGVFVCGPFTEPKDIPETVMQASGSAACAMAMLAEERNTLVERREYPPEKDVSGESPRVGVFVCHCGRNIGGVANVPDVVKYAAGLANVIHAEDNLYTCSADTQQHIKEMIEKHGLNRVVVASCTPRTHEPLFQDTIRAMGLNPYLFEMANIRDQCTWVHMQQPAEATAKSKDLVRMAVAKARRIEPLPMRKLPVTKDALVIGGGLAGMTAALALADQGFKTHLVERETELGGNLRHIFYQAPGEGNLGTPASLPAPSRGPSTLTPTLPQREPLGAPASLPAPSAARSDRAPTDDPQTLLRSLIEKVTTHPKIVLHKGTRAVETSGFYGNFVTKLSPLPEGEGATLQINHGVIIVATGAEELKPGEYKEFLYGTDPRVVTQVELEERIHKGHFKAGTVVMIQCVGSRDKTRPYCSRICCYVAVKNALKIKEISPETDVYVLYRDMRTYGFNETLYTKARELGVRFIRFDEDRKPMVGDALFPPFEKGGAGGDLSGEPRRSGENPPSPPFTKGGNGEGESRANLSVSVFDAMLGADLKLSPDLVVLSAATVPHGDVEELATLLKVPLNQNKFFLEAHMKLRPVDFQSDGIFLCGLAHSPKRIGETIAQALAAASRATTVLAQEFIEIPGAVAEVDESVCAGCGVCVEMCPYRAIELQTVEGLAPRTYGAVAVEAKRVARVGETCKGCGSCAAYCPSGAISPKHFKDGQILAQVDAASGG